MEILSTILLSGGILTILIGFNILSIGAVEKNRKKLKNGAIVILSGGVALLLSFSLCSSNGYQL